MRPHIVKTIAGKELREALRGRRTLFMMVVLPILLDPALLVLVTQVTMAQMAELEEQPSTVGVLGGSEDHPFVVRLRGHELLEPDLVERVTLRQVDLVADISGWPAEPDIAESPPVTLHYQSVDDESRQALDRVEELLLDWIDDEMARRIEVEGLPETFDEPLSVERENHSTQREQGGMLLASQRRRRHRRVRARRGGRAGADADRRGRRRAADAGAVDLAALPASRTPIRRVSDRAGAQVGFLRSAPHSSQNE